MTLADDFTLYTNLVFSVTVYKHDVHLKPRKELQTQRIAC